MKKLTKEQAKAYARVIKAMERAKDKGLRFYAKQWDLVAFNESTEAYLSDNDLLDRSRCEGANYIECFTNSILSDSSADDFERYKNNSDDPYKGEYQETPIWQNYI